MEASKFVSTPKKKGLGFKKVNDVIYYSSPHDLRSRLAELCVVKQAGNNGVDNTIYAILDELLEKNVINKTEYNSLYNKIFSIP